MYTALKCCVFSGEKPEKEGKPGKEGAHKEHKEDKKDKKDRDKDKDKRKSWMINNWDNYQNCTLYFKWPFLNFHVSVLFVICNLKIFVYYASQMVNG